jgi:hypothetical protein
MAVAIPAPVGLMGFSQTYFIVSNQILIQTVVPDSVRRRASSVWQYEQGITTLFVFLISLPAERGGIGFALSAVAVVSLSKGILFLVRFKNNRSLD